MTAAENRPVRKRLGVLELAKKLGNVSEACRRRGASRSQFYEYQRRFQTLGLKGLVDRPTIHKSHPQTTPPEVVRKIRDLALARPAHGCYRLSDLLQSTGVSVSGVTIQKILNRRGMGTQSERLLRLEEMATYAQIQPNQEQSAAVEKANPCFGERHEESALPGAQPGQGTFHIATLRWMGEVYLQAVVDAHGGFAFGYLHPGNLPEQAVAVLHGDVLPPYENWGLEVRAILTHAGRPYGGPTPSLAKMFSVSTTGTTRRKRWDHCTSMALGSGSAVR